MSTSGIYCIVNTANGKMYVGSAVDLRVRELNHWSTLRRGVHANRHLQGAWNKYSEAVFNFGVLEYVEDPTRLVEVEQQYLDRLDVLNPAVGYNKYPVAGSPYGHRKSMETRLKMSADKMKTPSYTRAVCQLTRNGEYVKTWNSAAEAARYFRVRRAAIHRVCSGKSKSSCGYQWCYADELKKYLNTVQDYVHPANRKKFGVAA